MDFQENHHSQGVEYGLHEVQYYNNKIHQIFSQSEAWQGQPLELGLQLKSRQDSTQKKKKKKSMFTIIILRESEGGEGGVSVLQGCNSNPHDARRFSTTSYYKRKRKKTYF